MTAQPVQLTATVVRNGTQFDHWTLSGVANCSNPATCTIPVSKGNSADITVNISDPNGPSSGPQQVTFAASPIFATPSQKAEINSNSVAGSGTTTLSFKDHNWDAGNVGFVMKFNNAPPIDPIIQNGGGGPGITSTHLPTSTTAFIADLGIALVVGFVLALIGRRLFR